MFDFDGDHATLVRPPHKAAATPNNWAKDPSGPGANDGTRITASLINSIVGNLRHLLSAFDISLPGSSDDALKLAILAAINEVVTEALENLEIAVADLIDGDGYVRMTDAERAKLAALVANYKGAFANLAAVEAAYPEAAAGDWAVVMRPGDPAAVVLWDADEEKWVEAGGSPPQTAAQVPFTPAGNIASANVQAALQELDEKKQPALGFTPVPNTRTVTGSGLASGGGPLLEDLSINVPKADGADMRAGQNDDKALTTKAAYDAMAEVTLTDATTITIDLQAGTDFTVTLNGNRTLANPTNADKVIGKKGRIRISHSDRTLAFGSNWEFANGEAPSLSAGTSKTDVLYYDVISATRILASLVPDIS